MLRKNKEERTFISAKNLYIAYLGVIEYLGDDIVCSNEELNKKFVIVQKGFTNKDYKDCCKALFLKTEYLYFYKMYDYELESNVGQMAVGKEIHISQLDNIETKDKYSLAELRKIEDDLNAPAKENLIENRFLKEVLEVSKKLQSISDVSKKEKIKRKIQELASAYSNELIELKTQEPKFELTLKSEMSLDIEYMQKLSYIDVEIDSLIDESSIINDLQILKRKINE